MDSHNLEIKIKSEPSSTDRETADEAMNSHHVETKIKSNPSTDGETADEASNLLGNGILVETSTGLICMSLNDALSLNSNLSVDDLRNVAVQLISQQNVSAHFIGKSAQTSMSCDSDGFSSECSDISTTTSGSTVPSSYKVFPPLLSEIHSNIIKYGKQIQGIIRPNVNTAKNSVDEKATVDIISSHGGVDSEAINIYNKPVEPATQIPVMTKTLTDALKPKKGRGGWPKGRKRKPELLNLSPKAPATGYTLYLNEQRKLFKESKLVFHEITKIIGNKWSSLTLEEKKPYLEKAEEDKKRYREELKQYRQSDAYRSYLIKKRKKRLQNNVLSESDMDATDDFDEEDNEELYCRTCDQWFHNMHNKREHLQGKQHLQAIAGDITRELSSDDTLGTTSAVSFSTSLDESSLDGMPNSRTSGRGKCSETQTKLMNTSICDVMANLSNLVAKRETEVKILKNRQQEFILQQMALCDQLFQLNERHKKLQKDLLLLKEKEKESEHGIDQLWQIPSWFIINDFGTDSAATTTFSLNNGTG